MTLNDILETQTIYTNTNPHTLVEENRYLKKQLNNVIELLKTNKFYRYQISASDGVNRLNIITFTSLEIETIASYLDLFNYVQVGDICFIGDIDTSVINYIGEKDDDNGLYIYQYDNTQTLASFKPTNFTITKL